MRFLLHSALILAAILFAAALDFWTGGRIFSLPWHFSFLFFAAIVIQSRFELPLLLLIGFVSASVLGLHGAGNTEAFLLYFGGFAVLRYALYRTDPIPVVPAHLGIFVYSLLASLVLFVLPVLLQTHEVPAAAFWLRLCAASGLYTLGALLFSLLNWRKR